MKIANVAAIALTAPLIMTALAVVFYQEDVGWRRWLAVVVGLIGTLFIVKPASSAFDLWAIVPLGAALGGAARDLLTRRIDPRIPSLAISFVGSVAVTLAGLMIGISEHWRAPAPGEWALIAIAGLFLGLGTWLLLLAFRNVEISTVAPFRYTLLIWIGIAGYLAFSEIPDGWSIFGAALIVSSGLYMLHREAIRRRDLTARTAPPG
jgi:drug/metabolite transporter (DMT)-like permease